MGQTKFFRKSIAIILFPCAWLLSWLSSFYPSAVEQIYASGIYKIIGQFLSRITGIFPFSLMEVSIILLFFSTVGILLYGFVHITRYKGIQKRTMLRIFTSILSFFCIAYFIFITLWGMNYHRLPFASIANLHIRPASVVELRELCKNLIIRANFLRTLVDENGQGVMYIAKGHKDVFFRAAKGYENASAIYPELDGKYGRPKGILFSNVMSYAGISGIYFPFTGEANVNTAIPDCMLPSTTCHEMAHQRGFAREDEANYIAYLACTMHPDADFQYSGILLALIHSMNTLSLHDPESYKQLKAMYSLSLQQDLLHWNQFWKRYEGPIERAASKANDAYLKSNLQEDGVHSYGRMVDLLLAEYRTAKDKSSKKLCQSP
ncbi:DUF3810 domain-containing protein [Thermotalea metallivorans]|uniref:DUF3810 domain-containing protein n=1 Tax=Thermotalea metallivorans TaxID=520762 RepID=A0A140L2C2_9FIRM|nr:DUF3810 domain-containing protein [Thermotalea metallivorans]KXG74697.1 hypothetical protein AN619_22040 [Thermotalea metallivorans]